MARDSSTPKAIVYAKTVVVYVKMRDAARGIWYDIGGKWNCAIMKGVGQAEGQAIVTASPEWAAGVVWRVSLEGKWVLQSGMAATAITEADIEAEKRRLVEEEADYVRIT